MKHLLTIFEKETPLIVFILAVLIAMATFQNCNFTIGKADAADIPAPTFAEVHLALVRISANESGFFSIADQDGILQSMLNGGGGGRVWGRRGRGRGYGLDYTRLMRRMVRHSKRTFPYQSKFLLLTDEGRWYVNHTKTRLNKWTSTMELDCREPAGWPARSLSGERTLPWTPEMRDRCKRLVATTHGLLTGRTQSYCDGEPLTWGNETDITRPGGALDKGWTEIHCDRPPGDPENCAQMTRSEIWTSSTGCARNTFWDWRRHR